MKKPSRSQLMEHLRYDPDTGLFWWKVASVRRKLDKPVGGPKGGYICVCFNRQHFLAHRLAWLFVKGCWPPTDIDHKNRNRSDNRWINLRLADRSQNAGNSTKYANNTSGFKGVSWFEGKWRAKIRNRYLGGFASPEEAHAAYVKAAKQHFGEFARAS